MTYHPLVKNLGLENGRLIAAYMIRMPGTKNNGPDLRKKSNLNKTKFGECVEFS